VDHPFGAIHPFTAGQKKEVERLLAEQKASFFSSGVVTAEQIKIIENLLDVKLMDKLGQFKTPVNVEVFPKFRVEPQQVNIMNPEKYFNWKDAVWSSALGIILGVVISKV
ncbi:MAG: hypothetical protein WA082_04300, partial [Candidatus Moraniibacteriota bacterium]